MDRIDNIGVDAARELFMLKHKQMYEAYAEAMLYASGRHPNRPGLDSIITNITAESAP